MTENENVSEKLEPCVRLGCHVRILETADIHGVVIEHTRFLDGSERWAVQYWHNGERRTVNCETRELAAHLEG